MNKNDKLTIVLGLIALLAVLATTAPAPAMNDPATGRWITRDPSYYDEAIVAPSPADFDTLQYLTKRSTPEVVTTANASQRVSLQLVLQNNPTSYIDWTGMAATEEVDCFDGQDCNPYLLLGPEYRGSGPRIGPTRQYGKRPKCLCPCIELHENISYGLYFMPCVRTQLAVRRCLRIPEEKERTNCIIAMTRAWFEWNHSECVHAQSECPGHLASYACFEICAAMVLCPCHEECKEEADKMRKDTARECAIALTCKPPPLVFPGPPYR
jgi:hypothetical protein